MALGGFPGDQGQHSASHVGITQTHDPCFCAWWACQDSVFVLVVALARPSSFP